MNLNEIKIDNNKNYNHVQNLANPEISDCTLSEARARVLVSADMIGAILGRNGKIIKTIRTKTNADIEIVKLETGCEHRIVNIRGTVKQLVDGLSFIFQLLSNINQIQGSPENGNSYPVYLLVPYFRVGAIMGVKGELVQNLRRMYGTIIKVSHETLPHSSEKALLVQGSSRGVYLTLYAIIQVLVEEERIQSSGDAPLYLPKAGAKPILTFAKRYFPDNDASPQCDNRCQENLVHHHQHPFKLLPNHLNLSYTQNVPVFEGLYSTLEATMRPYSQSTTLYNQFPCFVSGSFKTPSPSNSQHVFSIPFINFNSLNHTAFQEQTNQQLFALEPVHIYKQHIVSNQYSACIPNMYNCVNCSCFSNQPSIYPCGKFDYSIPNLS